MQTTATALRQASTMALVVAFDELAHQATRESLAGRRRIDAELERRAGYATEDAHLDDLEA